MVRYTDEQLIAALRRAADGLGMTPSSIDIKSMEGFPDPVTYLKRFGSWNEAVRAAGLRPRRIREYTDKELVEALKRAADRLDRGPSMEEFGAMGGYPGAETIRKRFGSWDKALRKAGLEPMVVDRKKHTDDELLDALRRAADELGRTPTQKEIAAMDGYPSYMTYFKRFGSWNEALRLAGIEPRERHVRRYTEAELITLLKEAAAVLGRTPKTDDLQAMDAYPSWHTYHARFGSWNKALEAAGLRPRRIRNYTDEELVERLRGAADELGETPTKGMLRSIEGCPDPETYRNHFGSWANALRAAGLRPRPSARAVPS